MDMTTVTAAMGSIKASMDITQALVGLSNAQAIQAKVLELQRAMLEAQKAMFAVNEERSTLIASIRQLEEEAATQKAWNRERERYALAEISPGLFAYSLKSEEAAGEPQHHLCATCYQAGKKNILQGVRLQTYAGWETLHCHGCGAELRYYRSDLPPPPPPIRTIRRQQF